MPPSYYKNQVANNIGVSPAFKNSVFPGLK